MDIDIGSFVSSFLKNGCFASSWSHEKHHVLICLKGYSKPFQNGQWFTVLQAILGPMSFTQINGLSRSEMVVHVFFRAVSCFFFHAMCRPTSQFISLLSDSNLIPVYRSAISFLPFTGSHIKRNAFMITMTDSIFEGVDITRLIQIG